MLLFLILRFFAPFITILRCVLSYCFTRLNERIKSINWTLLISVNSFLNHIILDKINQLKLIKKNIGICLYIRNKWLTFYSTIHTHKTQNREKSESLPRCTIQSVSSFTGHCRPVYVVDPIMSACKSGALFSRVVANFED